MNGILGTLKSGEAVVDRPNSHLHNDVTHKLLAEAFSQISSTEYFGQKIETTIDFGRIVGKTICVPTRTSDKIVFARRPNRFGFTRFVVGRVPVETSFLAIALQEDYSERQYILLTAYFGQRAPVEPWDKSANDDARKFWETHALVFGAEQQVYCWQCESNSGSYTSLYDVVLCERCYDALDVPLSQGQKRIVKAYKNLAGWPIPISFPAYIG